MQALSLVRGAAFCFRVRDVTLTAPGAPYPLTHSSTPPLSLLQQQQQAAALDAFEALSLGPGAPTMPGHPAEGGANPAAFPRPAGPAGESQVSPPPAYSPFNCKPQFVRLTTNAVPNSQVRLCWESVGGW